VITLQSGILRVSIDADLGSGIADFSAKGPTGFFFPLMRRAAHGETNASLLGSFVMAPWVNRIGGAKFRWNGREHALIANTADGMAQHGDVRKRAWRVVSQSASSATMEIDSREFPKDVRANWPWAFVSRQRFALESISESEAALTIELSVQNVDREPFPAGCGHHPYFMRRLWDDRDQVEVRAKCAGRYPLERGCAIGAMRADPLVDLLAQGGALPDQPIDGVLGGFDGTAELRWPASGVTLTMTCSPELNHLVVFAPHAKGDRTSPLSFIAVEPQSHVNDALNLVAKGQVSAASAGVRVLEPGQMLGTKVRLAVRIGA
jgi:aldose 1-epimerase